MFAQHVLANCGRRCVFCGLKPAAFGAARMLLAGHIKPWKDSTPAERLDLRNGLAACPAHDVAFDTGLLTVNGGLRIHRASRLADAVQNDPLARQYYGRPPLHETLLLPPGAQAPARKYLAWHRNHVFAALKKNPAGAPTSDERRGPAPVNRSCLSAQTQRSLPVISPVPLPACGRRRPPFCSSERNATAHRAGLNDQQVATLAHAE